MRLGEIFSSGMVFAAGKPIRIFGYGEGVATVSFAGASKTVVSNQDKWCVEFPAMEYGGAYELSFCENGECVVLDDIYIGEVYLFSGQSNMSFLLSESNTDQSLYEDNDKLRCLTVYPAFEIEPWRTARQDIVGSWSALGYLVSREIVKQKKIHVGIILCALGATVIETWMPEGALYKIGINISECDKFHDHYSPTYCERNRDGVLYNTKLKYIMPFSLSGVVWYQGESDASVAEGEVYERELCELINIWRSDFMDGDLPFSIVQLADTESRIALGPGWGMIQDAQARISRYFHNTYTVISRDVCETDNIHPPTKYKLAQRIADVIIAHFFN